MVQFPFGEQEGDTIHRPAFRKERRLKAAHRHGHRHALAKLHSASIVVIAAATASAFNFDFCFAVRGHGHGERFGNREVAIVIVNS